MNENRLKTVAIIEDNPNNLKVLGTLLRQNGLNVVVATNGKQGIAVIEEVLPDLILSDVRMPEMDGYTMCRILKNNKTTHDIPIIFLTANNSTEDETNALSLGAVDFITKPINPPVVIARVMTHLSLREYTKGLEIQNRLLEENTRLRDDIDRIVQHDMKSPLQAVIAIPSMLMEEPGLDKKSVELLQLIVEAGDKLLFMVNSSLDLYKMEKGMYKLKPVSVSLYKIIHNVDQTLQSLRIAKNLKFCYTGFGENTADNIQVYGEEMLFLSLFSNLIKNAYEASPENENIFINAKLMDSIVQIEIMNCGEVPIPIRENFFSKYVTEGKDSGTGLGTYSAKLITETMGGTIQLDCSESGYTSLVLTFSAVQT